MKLNNKINRRHSIHNSLPIDIGIRIHGFRIILIVILVFIYAFNQPAFSQGYLKTSGQKIVNEKGENVLLRGMGLGGWMLQEGYMLGINQEGQQHKIRQRIEELIGPKQTDEFYDVWLSHFIRKIDIDSMRAWGFNSVRLPMHFNLYTLPIDKEPVKGENTWLEKGFQMTDSLLKWCKANKMYLILDLHAAPGGQGNDLNISDRDATKPSLWEDEANQKKTIALWKKLAERYVNESWIGAYDIINEPNWGFSDLVNDKNGTKEKDNAPLKKLMVDITAAIRSVDKKHIIIIEGNGWGNNYNGIFPPWDENMVLSYHKYWNKNDLASIQGMLDSRTKYNIPIWLGETGENSNVWFRDCIRLLEENNIGWAWWPLKKLGFNNPLQIRSNLNYDQVLAYWSGRGNKPKDSNAYSGLLELATYTRFESNIIHRDVIDAMFRQPFDNSTKPFKKLQLKQSLKINAVDFDLGRNGYAYFDMDTVNFRSVGINGQGNRGRMYRNDAVDIRKDSSAYESYYVSDIEKGEWLQYTIDVASQGNYTLILTVSTDKSAGAISISNGRTIIAPSQPLPNTGGPKTWQTVEIKNVKLEKGVQTIRIVTEEGGFNLKSIEVRK